MAPSLYHSAGQSVEPAVSKLTCCDQLLHGLNPAEVHVDMQIQSAATHAMYHKLRTLFG